MMSEKRFWFVIDKGKLEYVQDNITGKKITVTDLEDLLNEQQTIIHKLQDLCGQSDGENAKLRIENKDLRSQLNKIPPKIREIWLDD